tara:strand:- start:3280 stop:3999 length:720 start_codon:yes stop_codon:yes gene_type:complete
MRQSSTEFSQLLVKAGRGVGLPLGLAEDLIDPVIWLQICGFPGEYEVHVALATLDEGRTEARFPDLLNTDEAISSGRVSAVYLATAACDLLQLDWPQAGEEVLLPETESPRLVAAALILSHRLLRRERYLRIVTPDEVFISGPGAEITCVSKELEHRTSSGIDKGVIRLSTEQSGFDGEGTVLIDVEKEARFQEVCRLKGLCASPDIIAQLKTFSDRLLVPESEHSLKFGAGAGIVDSD